MSLSARDPGPEKIRPRYKGMILVGGLVFCQVVLYAPSLFLGRILLPLDLLALPNFYLPRTPEYQHVVPRNRVYLDQIQGFEIDRRFTAKELRSGQLPVWNPYLYSGVPSVSWPKYSPFNFLYYLFPDPRVLVWMQMLQALVAGIGAYVFFRKIVKVSFWPAAFGGWCFPLTGFFILWQGFPATYTVALLPWVLLATDLAVRQPLGWGGPALAAMTGLTLISGQLDMAGLVLLTSGFFALWRLMDEYGKTKVWSVLGAGLATTGSWALGFMLASPYWLPIVEYTQSGSRFKARQIGIEERPPVGWEALPLILVPEYYGSTQKGSLFISDFWEPDRKRFGNLVESTAMGYAGLLAALFLAPLAWCHEGRRRLVVFWSIAAGVGLSWSLDVPGLVNLMRMPGLNVLSYNRFAFVTAFAILCLAVMGLEILPRVHRPPSHLVFLAMGIAAYFGGWCFFRVWNLPEPVSSQLENPQLQNFLGITPVEVKQIQLRFTMTYFGGAILCGLSLVGWWLIRRRPIQAWLPYLVGGLAATELLWFAFGQHSQSDSDLYYPNLPIFEKLVERMEKEPGRILGFFCLPSNLNMTYEMPDIRGYDGVDPLHYLELLSKADDPKARKGKPEYAQIQWYVPNVQFPNGEIQIPHIMNLLGVRYWIFRGQPPRDKDNRVTPFQPLFQEEDYWVWENTKALPRVFIPRKVTAVPKDNLILEYLGDEKFDPAQLAYVAGSDPHLEDCRGKVKIKKETHTEITLTVEMESPRGLVVLADRWDQNWHAYLGNEEIPIHRANYALRGVVLSQGSQTLVFRYQPRALHFGFRLCLTGIGLGALWSAILIFRKNLTRLGKSFLLGHSRNPP